MLFPYFVGEALGLTLIETIIVVLLGGLFAGMPGVIFAVPTVRKCFRLKLLIWTYSAVSVPSLAAIFKSGNNKVRGYIARHAVLTKHCQDCGNLITLNGGCSSGAWFRNVVTHSNSSASSSACSM